MGTGYDCSDLKANTATPAITPEQRKWRNTLVAAMGQQGFVNYLREWWHFSLPGAGGQAYDFPIKRAATIADFEEQIGPWHRLHSQPTKCFNQSPPFEDVDLFAAGPSAVEAVAANGGAAADREFSEFGRHWGLAAMAERGRIANENTPKLRTFDARGYRRDEIEFHPAYHELMAHCAHAGMHNSTWDARGQPAGGASEVVRAAFYMAAQVETGHLCPITMTRASVAALATQPDLLAKAMPVIATRSYDPAFAPWPTKRGMTLGMGMTEKQGGTDVRANMTRAERDDDAYRITGHKWFMSAPMCDAFLVLAQADEGLSCFFMPRFAPDGSVNAIHFQRLKDKLGNRSNASSEVEFARRLCVARRRRRQGHPHHHPDGAVDTAGLRDCLRRPDALRARACAASRASSQRVPEASCRSAADAGGAVGHGAACRGVHRAGDAALPCVRSRAAMTPKRRPICGC